MAEIRRELDDLESTFIESIAKYLSITPEIIKADFGGGGVVIGKEAVKRNMADALGTYEEVLGLLNQQNQSITINNQIMSKEQNKEINAGISKKEITADYIKKEFPDVTNAIIQEVSSDIKKEAFADGAKHERDRILAIESTTLPGHEDLIAEAKKDGSITAEKLALKIIAAEKSKASDYLANSKTSESEMPKIEPNICLLYTSPSPRD